MIFAHLTTEEDEQLQQALKQATIRRRYLRLKIIDLSAKRYTVPQLVKLFDLSPATIRSYIHQFNEAGLASVTFAHSSGRKPKLSWNKADWLELLNEPPAAHERLESGAQNWTHALLQKYLARYHDLQVSQATLSKSLRAVGIHWRRAKLRVHSPDPLYQVKRQRVETLRTKARQGSLSVQDASRPPPDEEKPAYLAFFDATDLHWCPDIGSTYGPVNQQRRVNSPGLANPWLALMGSLIYPSGEGVYSIHQRKRSAEAIAHLQLLIDLDPDAFWFVVIDNAAAHHTAKMVAFEQQHRHRLELVFLPTYSPHLNLIERLWRVMRAQVTRNQFFPSLPNLAVAVINWLEKLPFSDFCSIVSIDEAELGFV